MYQNLLMNTHILEFSESDENIPPLDLKQYRSIDHAEHISIKERKAKKNLFELGIEEDNRFSMQLKTPVPKKQKIICINPWNNQNLQDSKQFQKFKQQGSTSIFHRSDQSKPFAQKQTNIPYLKDLLLRLQSPNSKKGSFNKKGFYYGSFQESLKNNYKSARVSEAIKVKQNWVHKQGDPRSIYEVISSASCRLNRSQSRGAKNRTTSQNSKRLLQNIKQNDLVKMILQKKKESLVKKKKVSPAKILNFNARTLQTKIKPREKFNLFQLLH